MMGDKANAVIVEILGKQSSSTIEWLKYLAIISMLIDHAAVVLFESSPILRGIGRIAFLFFTYTLVHNYLFFTKNRLHFVRRLVLFGIFVQPIYYFTFDKFLGNIFLLFSLSLIVFYLYETYIENKGLSRNTYLTFAFLLFMAGMIASLFTEYSWDGYLFIVGLYMAFKDNSYWRLPPAFILFLYHSNIYFLIISYFSIYLLLILRNVPYKLTQVNRLFFYLFYPTHLLILLLLKAI